MFVEDEIMYRQELLFVAGTTAVFFILFSFRLFHPWSSCVLMHNLKIEGNDNLCFNT